MSLAFAKHVVQGHYGDHQLVGLHDKSIWLKGLCKAISLHLHKAEKSKNNPLKLMAHTCC